MSDFTPLSVPHLAGNEWEYLKECVDTGWVATGPFLPRFETAMAEWVGSPFTVACASGTAALHVSLRLAGVQAGDLVLAPTLTFIAPVNALRYLGADPVFFDCDAHFNLDPGAVLAFLESETEEQEGGVRHRASGRRIGALVTVHVFGNAGGWAELFDTCCSLGIPVVEDATEALGTRYIQGPWEGRHAGTTADFGCFSFNGNKIITTGGGGMIVTQDEGRAQGARYLVNQAKDDPAVYRHDQVGYNYRMSNLSAALGLAQLEQLDEFLVRKRAHHLAYAERIAEMEWCELRRPPEYARNNNWLNALYVREGPWRGRATELSEALVKAGIGARPVWRLIHQQVPYAHCLCTGSATAEDLVANTVNLPSSVGLTEEDIEGVCQELARV